MSVLTWCVTVAVRCLVAAGVWWAVSEGDLSMAGYGAVAVVLCVLVSLVAWRPQPISPRGWLGRSVAAIRLFGWFVGRSIVGGTDVALRAIRRSVRVEPGFVDYTLRLDSAAARVAVVDLVNLMPGSLSTEMVGDQVRIHVIDVALPVARTLADLERRLAAVIGVSLPDDP